MTSTYDREIGQVLWAARQELRLDIAEASQALHIRAHYLRALETGELSILPGAAYTKGYLQAYAIFLRLDKDEILRRFERVQGHLPQRGFYFPQVFSKEKKPQTTMVWGGVAGVVVLYFVWWLCFKPPAMPEFVVDSVPVAPARAEAELLVEQVDTPLNLACARLQVEVYPPCYRVAAQPALHRPLRSVMELPF